MEKDLLREMGMIEVEDEELEEECKESMDEVNQGTNNAGEISYLQLEVEDSMRNEFTCIPKESFIDAEMNIKRNLVPLSVEDDIVAEGIENIDIASKSVKGVINQKSRDLNVKHKEDVTDSHLTAETFDSEDEQVGTEIFSDSRSMYSNTTAATIAPEVIKKKVKVALQKREDREKSRRILVKGEANAVTRVRRDNRDTIKQSTGIWGWE